MGTISPEEKARRHRERMLQVARQSQVGTYIRSVVAPLFQKMIRAEAAALPECCTDVINLGEHSLVFRRVGQCACVTCGKLLPWKGNGPWKENQLHTGHFLASRRNSILFEEDNCAPQCSHCNYVQSGEQQLFRKWMIAVRGQKVVERLERLKNEVRVFTREELVDMRIGYAARLQAAEERMNLTPDED